MKCTTFQNICSKVSPFLPESSSQSVSGSVLSVSLEMLTHGHSSLQSGIPPTPMLLSIFSLGVASPTYVLTGNWQGLKAGLTAWVAFEW